MIESKNYKEEFKSDFQFVECKADNVLLSKNFDTDNHLLFLLSGKIKIVYGNLGPRVISENNMIFLPALSNCVCETLMPVKAIMLEFDGLNYGCDPHVFQNLIPIFTLIKYEFHELEIRYPLNVYLELIMEYLGQEVAGKSLSRIKIQELFILFRAYYNSEELTMLFYPLLGKNIEFKKMVMDNYLKVKNASEYAEICGYSFSVFQRKFKDIFGETIYQWMQRQKAEQIKHHLMVEDLNPKELVDEFDFASPAHLNKFCKVWFGMTPSELRQTYILRKNLK